MRGARGMIKNRRCHIVCAVYTTTTAVQLVHIQYHRTRRRCVERELLRALPVPQRCTRHVQTTRNAAN